jgi:hypothetical protein
MNHNVEADLPDDDAEQLRLSRRIQQSLDPYLTTFISVSATLRFLPPYPLSRMKELDDELTRAKHAWEDEVVRREEKQPSTAIRGSTSTPQLSDHDDIKAQIESLSNPALAMTSRLEKHLLLRMNWDTSTTDQFLPLLKLLYLLRFRRLEPPLRNLWCSNQPKTLPWKANTTL